MSSKTIKINPDFFSVKQHENNKNKDTRKKKKSKSNKVYKPNKVKNELLEKIKNHQKQRKENNNVDKDTKVLERPFDEQLSESMDYLDKIIEKNKEKRRKKKEKKNKRKNNNIVVKKELDNTSEKKPQIQHENINKIEIKTQNENNIQDNTNLQTIKTKINFDNKNNKTIKKHIVKDDPPFGVLKGGKKPTYSQYHTIKNNTNNKNKPLIEIKDDKPEEIKTENPVILDRKNRLNKIKNKIKTNTKPNNNSIFKKLKKFRLKTTTKTYKLGKNKKDRKVSIMLKNNITKKKVSQDINTIKKTPIQDIKQYLRKKNLIKYTSTTPDYILRDLYTNALLTGDLENNNSTNMVYNYLNANDDH